MCEYVSSKPKQANEMMETIKFIEWKWLRFWDIYFVTLSFSKY